MYTRCDETILLIIPSYLRDLLQIGKEMNTFSGDSKKYASAVISALVTNFLFHPLDAIRIKVLFELKLSSFAKLYNGIVFNCSATIIERCAMYPTQEFIKSRLTNLGDVQSDVISGMSSGVMLSLAANPMNTIRVSLMSDSSLKTLDAVKLIYNSRGIAGFYRGTSPTLLRDIVYTGIYFPLFNLINNKIDNKFASSAFAALIAMIFAYPFDERRYTERAIRHEVISSE